MREAHGNLHPQALPLNTVRPCRVVLPSGALRCILSLGRDYLEFLPRLPMTILAVPLLTHRPNFYFDPMR